MTERTAVVESTTQVAGAAAAPHDRRSARVIALGILASARPRQWLKNLLLVAAPGAAGVLGEGDVVADLAIAYVAFCLVASGTYLLNDVRDAEADQAHPVKRLRPVAAGAVSARVAVTAGVLLIVLGSGVALVVGIGFFGVVALYLALTIAYTLILKNVAVIDIAAVASGFLIRAVAGGVAAGVPISRWFLIVATFGSLFVVAGKRHGEHVDLGPERGAVRATLVTYPREYLRSVWTMASAVVVTAYCLWAFEETPPNAAVPWYELSIIPFVLFLLRYALLLESGKGGTPENLVLGDWTLRAMSVIWVIVFACGIYVDR